MKLSAILIVFVFLSKRVTLELIYKSFFEYYTFSQNKINEARKRKNKRIQRLKRDFQKHNESIRTIYYSSEIERTPIIQTTIFPRKQFSSHNEKSPTSITFIYKTLLPYGCVGKKNTFEHVLYYTDDTIRTLRLRPGTKTSRGKKALTL